MRLLNDTEGNWSVVERGKVTPLREYCKRVRIEQGYSVSGLQNLMGATHPMYSNYENGITKTDAWGFAALEALGYAIYIFPTND
jgi:hypothetical protein